MLLGMVITSCKKFLDVSPKGKTLLTDIEHYNGLMNNPYLGGFQYLKFTATSNAETGDVGYSFSILGEVQAPFFMADDVVANEQTFQNFSLIQRNLHAWEPDVYLESEHSAEWGAMYTFNYIYNLVINGVMDAEGGTEQQKRSLQAEARVARAYMHFWSAQLFAPPYTESTAATDLGVPIVQVADTEAQGFERSSVKAVYDFILSEIQEAIPHLQDVTVNRSRFSKLTAYYMLGEVYFHMKKYDLALDALTQAANLVSASSMPLGLYDYNVKAPGWYIAFMPNMGMINHPNPFVSEENIYVVQTAAPIYSAMSSLTVLRDDVYALFETSDHRRKIYSNRGLFSSAQVLPGFQRAGTGTVNVAASLPNLYLMKAECAARANRLPEAKADLELLRQNRMPAADAAVSYTSQSDLIGQILDERLREFAATGLRWLDMRRLFDDTAYGNVHKTRTIDGQTRTLTRERLTLRIPPSVLQYNPTMPNNP